MLKTLSATLALFVLLAAGLYASLVPPPPQYVVPMSHRARTLRSMHAGAVGYVSRYELSMGADGKLWVDADARYEFRSSLSQPVRVARVRAGVCVDERTLPYDLSESLPSRYARSLMVVNCDNFIFLWGYP